MADIKDIDSTDIKNVSDIGVGICFEASVLNITSVTSKGRTWLNLMLASKQTFSHQILWKLWANEKDQYKEFLEPGVMWHYITACGVARMWCHAHNAHHALW